MRIVTGANGFVGRHLVESLGGDVRGLVRADVPAWSVEALERALAGASAVIHSASVVHKPGTPPSEYRSFNVEGTRALVGAARRAKVRRFVFVSSIKVHGESPAGVIDESTPVAAEADYAATKAEAEQIVLDATDLAPVVLRLCPVYGRGDKGNVRTMIRAIARGRFFVPGDGSARKSIVHVSSVVDVVRAVLARDAGGVFVVANTPTPSIRELSDAIARALGKRRPRAIPRPLLRGAAEIGGRLARALRVRTAVSGELIDKAMRDSVCDPGRAQRELGLDMKVDLDATLRDEIAWLRASGLC